MSIEIDDAKFRDIVAATAMSGRLDAVEIEAIAGIVQLAAAVDLEEDVAEHALVDALLLRLAALGDGTARIVALARVPIDDEERAARIAMFAQEVYSDGARELAYALANLVIVVDLELAPIETRLLVDLQHALGLDAARASELLATISQIVTPGARGTADDIAASPG